MSIDKEILDRLMESRAPGDLFGKGGILSELTKSLAERALSTEMDIHLDEERAEEAPGGRNRPSNRRNGSSQKTVTTDGGEVVLDIPRDRNGTFDPILIAKYQRRLAGADAIRRRDGSTDHSQAYPSNAACRGHAHVPRKES
ncbi:Transposase, Mutator family [Roseovarius lutimaris]|uniref:Mutator family transposase n=1 Tax=Roseovarius lutimaris TaxID=1005928 RepID=A0A1I5GQ08_9RHOB|nr:Transposase, Mutator family [Roseovarius lutimaris]